MANNFDSNFTRKVLEEVAPRFESARVLTKNVNTQFFQGAFDPNSGDNVDIKRPTDYKSARTSTGDITGTKRDIITGKATATVQDYITIPVDFNEADEALKMGSDMDRFWDDIANRAVVDFETSFATYAMQNAGLALGTAGTGVSSFAEIAGASALMKSVGVPQSKRWGCFVNPYSQTSLAVETRGLGVNPEVKNASEEAMIRKAFAGFDVYSTDSLATFTTGAGADRAGTLSANPDVTYVTHKDTMKQTLAVTGFQANLPVKAGDIITISGRNRLNQSTRTAFVNAAGAPVAFTAVVAADVTLGASGEGNIVINGPAIYEATGAYNTVDSAPVSGDVVTLSGAASTLMQPALFYHPDAYSIASVGMKKLYSTDTLFKTADGLQMRVSKYSDGDANKQTVRFDLRFAYATVNPSFAGLLYGTP